MATQTKRRNKGTTKMAAPTKAAPKRARGGQGRAVDQKTLQLVVKRLRGRESTLLAEARGLGFKGNGPLRARLLKHLGSKAKYREVVRVGKRPKGKGDKGAKSE